MNGTVVRFPVERTRPARLVDMRGLTDHFGYSERWFRYRIGEGMPAHRWGRRLRFSVEEVEAWLNERYGGNNAA